MKVDSAIKKKTVIVRNYSQRLYYSFVLAFSIIQSMDDDPKWKMLKDLCIKQNTDFKEWQKDRNFNEFHCSHYDWWAFPIDRKSSYGDKYRASLEERSILIKDRYFIEALRSNAILVCQAWGYDLIKGEEIHIKEEDQCWQDWPIRLHKIVESLQYFDQEDLFLHGIKYGLQLISEGKDFTYGDKNLKELFFNNQVYFTSKQKEKLSTNIIKTENREQIKQQSKISKEEQTKISNSSKIKTEQHLKQLFNGQIKKSK